MTAARLAMLALAWCTSGCLDQLVPLHKRSTVTDDGGMAAPEARPDLATGEEPSPEPSLGTDGGTAAADLADAATAPSLDMTDCVPRAAANGDGHHNEGQDCLPCHLAEAMAPDFTIAGTVYSALTGGTPAAGVTVEIRDSNNVLTKLVTASNGNFYTTAPIVHPVTVKASACPTTQRMSDPVGATGASCNSCHNAGMQIHVP